MSPPHNSHSALAPKALIPPHEPLMGCLPKMTPKDIKVMMVKTMINVRIRVVMLSV